MTRVSFRRVGRRFGLVAPLSMLVIGLSACPGWFAQYSTTDHSYLTGISCPDASTCFVVGAASSTGPTVIKRSTDYGDQWTDLSSTAPSSTLTRISCADSNDCVVAGQGVFSTSDGGSTWTTLVPPMNGVSATALSCADLMKCWVGWNNSEVSLTTDGGVTWSNAPLATSVTGAVNPALTSITCPTASECIGLGEQTVWINNPPYPPFSLIYGLLASSTDGGTTWQSETVTEPDGAVSCLTTTKCIDSNGPQLLVTADGGSTWSASELGVYGYPAPFDGPAITCPDAQHCTEVGPGFVLGTADGGATWNVEPTNPSGVYLNAISCSSVASCWAAGSSKSAPSYGSIVLHTTTGGVARPSISSITPTQGPATGGTQVTIMGAGFTGAPTVTFGSGSGATPGTNVTVVSSKELTVTSPSCNCSPPPGGYSVLITITEPVLGSSPINFNYPFTYLSP
jgi:photosystem II stability/assembly factor-like uncharacterized protein